MSEHNHYWSYEHAVWQGRTVNEVGVVRYCGCGVKQMAFTRDWRKPRRSCDLRDVGKQPEAPHD